MARAMDPVARGPFSTSMAAPATIFESAGLSCSRDELLYRRDLTKADLSISCGSCTHTATAAQYLELELQLQLQTLI